MYYYKHVNGTVIGKPDYVVDTGGGPHCYFESPFCVHWWHEENAPTAEVKDQMITDIQRMGQEADNEV